MGEKREKWADIVKENCGEEWLSYCLRCVHAQTDPYASDMSWECVTCDPVVKIPHSNFEPRPVVIEVCDKPCRPCPEREHCPGALEWGAHEDEEVEKP